MDRLQEAIGLGLVLGVLHGLLAPVAKAVPVVPNFTQGSMTSHTAVSYTHLRAHETSLHLVCRLLLEKKK